VCNTAGQPVRRGEERARARDSLRKSHAGRALLSGPHDAIKAPNLSSGVSPRAASRPCGTARFLSCCRNRKRLGDALIGFWSLRLPCCPRSGTHLQGY